MSENLTVNNNDQNQNYIEKNFKNINNNNVKINKNLENIIIQFNLDFEKIRQINNKFITDIKSLLNELNEIIQIIGEKPYINKMQHLLGKSKILLKGIENLLLNNNKLEDNFNSTQINLYNLLEQKSIENDSKENNNLNSEIKFDIKNELIRKDKQISNLNSILLENLKEINKFKRSLFDEKEQKKYLINNSKSFSESLKTLKNLMDKEESIKTKENQLDNTHTIKDINTLKEENKEFSEKNVNLENQITDLNNQLQLKEKEIKIMKENLNKETIMFQEIQKKIKENDYEKLKESLQEKEKIIEDNNTLINKIKKDLDEKTNKIEELNKTIELNNNQVKKLTSILAEKQQSILSSKKELGKQIDNLEKEKYELESQLKEQEQLTLKNMQKLTSKNNAMNKEMQEKINENVNLLTINKNNKNKIDELEKKIVDLNKNINDINTQLIEANSKLKTKEDLLKQFQNQLSNNPSNEFNHNEKNEIEQSQKIEEENNKYKTEIENNKKVIDELNNKILENNKNNKKFNSEKIIPKKNINEIIYIGLKKDDKQNKDNSKIFIEENSKLKKELELLKHEKENIKTHLKQFLANIDIPNNKKDIVNSLIKELDYDENDLKEKIIKYNTEEKKKKGIFGIFGKK